MSVDLPCDRSLVFNAPVKNPFLTAAEMDSRLKAPGCVANAVMCCTVAGPAESGWQIHETGTASSLIEVHLHLHIHQVMQGNYGRSRTRTFHYCTWGQCVAMLSAGIHSDEHRAPLHDREKRASDP
jgi:hypothetical protein